MEKPNKNGKKRFIVLTDDELEAKKIKLTKTKTLKNRTNELTMPFENFLLNVDAKVQNIGSLKKLN